MARHLTRATPVCSSTLESSRTSTVSPMASFRIVLPSLTAKVDVIAISLTHFRYSWSISRSPSLERPAEYLLSPRSSWLAFGRVASGIFSTKLRMLAALTDPPSLNCFHNASMDVSSFRTCTRSAPVTAACASSVTFLVALRRAATWFWHFDFHESSLTLCLTSAERASVKGLLLLLLISSWLSLIAFRDVAIASMVASRSFCAWPIACNGSFRSAPPDLTSSSAAGRCFSTCCCTVFTVSAAPSSMRLEAALSTASWRRFFSASMVSACFFWACMTCFLSCACSAFTFTTRGFSFNSSVFVSASGPAFTAFSSSIFLSMYCTVLVVASMSSWTACLTSFSHAV
mmetsp:Transcript_97484/g.276252  ORF Transcript_97484/g.276252 Transcript_97484/m.276252 type:complete len:344 (+) Transcript_97484:1016-2047(+)